MTDEEKPALNSWYETEEGVVFQVTRIDEDNGIIETQVLSGLIGEIDMASWESMVLKEVQPPENWQGSMDENRSDWKEFQK